MSRRKVSRRDFLAASGAATAGALLAACGPAAAPAAESDSGDMPAAEGYSIVYTYPHPDTNMLGGNQRLILERYDSMVPGTEVQVELKTGYEMSRVQADLAAGTAPDLFWAGYTSVIQAIDEGLIVNQQDYMEASGVDFDDFVDGIEAIYAPPTVGGHFWGMPYEQVVVLFAYNVAALEESGMEPPPKDWTWDDVIEWGVNVTRDVNGKRPNEDGFDPNEVDIWGVAYWQHFAIQEYLPWTAGQLYVDETRTKATINNDGVRDSLQYLRDAYASGSATEKPPEKGLVSGKVVFQEVGNWGLLDFEKQIGEGGLGALYTPSHPVHQITATPWYDKELWMPVQDDKNREAAAYEFSEWWALGDPYLEFCLETGYFPFTKSHFADQRWLDAIEGKEFMEIAGEMPAYATNTRFWALFKGAQEAQQSMYELWDLAVHTDEDLEVLMAAAEAEVQRIIDKYN